ncbi:MAG: hypothetical protein MJ252_03380 [archaeon]|nr:hypothetical protein [archaeon]
MSRRLNKSYNPITFSQAVSQSEPDASVVQGNKRPEAYSPYGVSFEQEKAYRKMQQRQYKEDLDYLCSLRKKDTQQKQRDLEEESKRLQMMNDVRYI